MEKKELTLADFKDVLLRNFKQIFLITLLGFILTLALSIIFITPKYNSEAQIVIKDNSAGASVTNDIQRVYTYKDMMKSSSMLNKIKRELKSKYHISKTKDEIRQLINVKQEPNSLIISLSVSDKNPKTAQKIVKVAVKQFVKYSEDYSKADTLKIQSKPSLPENSKSARLKVVVAGTFLFFAVACFLAIYQYVRDLDYSKNEDLSSDYFRNKEALENTNRLTRRDVREF